MGATTRREPVRNTIPKAKAYQYYNMLDFKGIEISDNPFNTTTGSCSDCLNVYVDKEGSLTTRPRLEIMSELKNIVTLQNATFIGVYGLVEGYLIHCTISNVNKFYRYVNNTLTAITDSDNLCPATRCKTFEQNDVIYILTGNNYLNIINNDLSEVEGYIPTVEVRTNTSEKGVMLEDYNLLTNEYYISYNWNWKNTTAFLPKNIDLKETDNIVTKKVYTSLDSLVPECFFKDGSYIGSELIGSGPYFNKLYYVHKVNDELSKTQLIFSTSSHGQQDKFKEVNIVASDTAEKMFAITIKYWTNLSDQSTEQETSFLCDLSDVANFQKYETSVAIGFYNRFSYKNNYLLSLNYIYDINTRIAYSKPYFHTEDSYSAQQSDMAIKAIDLSNDELTFCVVLYDTNVVTNTGYYAYIFNINDYKNNSNTSLYGIGKKGISLNLNDYSTFYNKAAYFKTQNTFVYSNYHINLTTKEVIQLPKTEILEDTNYFYVNKDNGYYILIKENTQNKLSLLIYPDIISNPEGVGLLDLTNDLATSKISQHIAVYNYDSATLYTRAYSMNPTRIYEITIRDGTEAKIKQKLEDGKEYDKWQERRQAFLNSLITSRFYNQRWFTSGSHIFYTSNNDPTYIPLYNYDLLGDDGYEVTGLNVISDTGMVAYTSKQLSIITPVKDRGDGNWDYSFTETKNTTGNVAKGNTIVTSYSTLPLQIDYKGIFTIQQTENVVSEANVVTPITNAIMRKWMKESETSRNMVENTRTMNYLYWTYFLLDTGTNTKIYVLDNRTLSWFYWEIPIRVMDMYVEDEEAVFFDYNGVKYIMKTEDINEHNNNEYNLRTYYDELPETNELIHWHWYSQILPLGSINFSKQLVATTFILNDDENTDNYGLRYKFRGFRKTIYETDNRDIEGDLQYVRNKTIRSMFTRIQFLQILLSDKADDLIGDYSRLRLVGLGFKYRLLEANRT